MSGRLTANQRKCLESCPLVPHLGFWAMIVPENRRRGIRPCFTKSTVTSLAKRGLVTKGADRVELTDAGRELVEAERAQARGGPAPGHRPYVVIDTRGLVGNCASFWAEGHNGYTCDLDRAHRFTEAEALELDDGRETDVAVPLDVVERLVVRHVRWDHIRRALREGGQR